MVTKLAGCAVQLLHRGKQYLALCERNPTDAVQLSYDARNPFDLCSLTYTPIYKYAAATACAPVTTC